MLASVTLFRIWSSFWWPEPINLRVTYNFLSLLAGKKLISLLVLFVCCCSFDLRTVRIAPAKRSQHLITTFPNIVGPTFASSDQTIATFQHNIVGAQHVARVRLATLVRPVATCRLLLIQIVKWSNFSQPHPTCHNRVAKRANNCCCVDM